MNLKHKHLLRRLSISLAAAFLALFMCELVVRVVCPQDMLSRFSWYEPHPVYRFRHRANLDRKARWFTEYRLRTNSRGLRENKDISYEHNGKYRVLVHGDSFTFGNGVDEDRVFCRHAEKHLHSRGLSQIQIVNMGVSAHGPSLEMLYFLEEGKKYHPKAVVVAVFTGNDATDEVRDRCFDLVDDVLIPRPYAIPFLKKLTNFRFYQVAIDNSHLIVMARSAVSAHSHRSAIRASCDLTSHDRTIKFAVRVWSQFANEIESVGAEPLFLILPTREQILAAQGKAMEKDAFPIANSTHKAVLKMCQDRQCRFVDMLPKFAESTNPSRFFVTSGDYIDFHYNEDGHALVGQALGEELIELARNSVDR